MGHLWFILVEKSVSLAKSTVTHHNLYVIVYSWPVYYLVGSAFGFLNPIVCCVEFLRKVFPHVVGITSLFPLKIKLFTMCSFPVYAIFYLKGDLQPVHLFLV